jgi:PDDEXK-like domain of unknown function (DUF3799)
MKPGIYPGIPMAEYLEIPAASASLIKTMVDECPRKAWHVSHLNPDRVRETSDGADCGTIAHEILLEGTQACVEIIDPADYPAKNGNIPNGWTNTSIRAARDDARTAGKIPVLPCDMVAINGMVDSARAYIESLRKDEPAIWAAFQPGGGDSELTCLWEDNGTLCRMRPDRISKDRGVVIDPKFTKRAAEPDSFGRTQLGPMGYRISAAFYRRGCEAMFATSPDYVFLVVEQEPPHLCSLVGVDPAGFELGAGQVETGLRQWRQCVKSGRWPAYPTRVCYPELMPWEQARWEAREVMSLDERLELASQA